MTGEEKVTLAKANLHSLSALAVAPSHAAIYIHVFKMHVIGHSVSIGKQTAY